MTTKFKPFDPTTAKNGDTVYGVPTGDEFKFIGKAHAVQDASVVYGVKTGNYVHVFDDYLQVAVPKKTVWVNIYESTAQYAYWYTTEHRALKAADATNPKYRGTFPIEIDAE